MRSIVVQKAVITSSGGKILLLRRSKTDVRRPLQWDLPGGLVDAGEDLIASIRREVGEETSLQAKGLVPIYSHTEVRDWDDNNGHHTDNVTFIFYRAESGSEDVALSFEHDKFQWATLRDAVGLFEYDLHIEALRYILDNNLLSQDA